MKNEDKERKIIIVQQVLSIIGFVCGIIGLVFSIGSLFLF